MNSATLCSISLTLVIFTQMHSAGLAQNQETNHSLEPSIWSLQFQISNNFTLRSFQGGVISAKYHFSKQRAFRFGLALSGTFEDRKLRNEEFTNGNQRLDRATDTDTNSQSIDLITQYIFYSTPKQLSFYGGIGPIVGFFRNKGDTKDDRLDIGVVETTKVETTRWVAGINTIIGGEWFAAKNISLLAEYAVLAVYDWRSDTQNRTIGTTREVITTDTKGLILDAQRVRFGLSLYF